MHSLPWSRRRRARPSRHTSVLCEGKHGGQRSVCNLTGGRTAWRGTHSQPSRLTFLHSAKTLAIIIFWKRHRQTCGLTMTLLFGMLSTRPKWTWSVEQLRVDAPQQINRIRRIKLGLSWPQSVGLPLLTPKRKGKHQ